MGNKVVTKTELIKLISDETGLSQVNTGSVVDATLKAIQNSLKDGSTVRLIGFGSFSVAERAEREGRNPATGQKMTIKASRVPKFKPGQEFKDAVSK